VKARCSMDAKEDKRYQIIDQLDEKPLQNPVSGYGISNEHEWHSLNPAILTLASAHSFHHAGEANKGPTSRSHLILN